MMPGDARQGGGGTPGFIAGRLGVHEGERLQTIPGTVPDPLAPIPGCPFLSRCPEGEPSLCGHAMPGLRALGDHWDVACYKRGSLPEIASTRTGA